MIDVWPQDVCSMDLVRFCNLGEGFDNAAIAMPHMAGMCSVI